MEFIKEYLIRKMHLIFEEGWTHSKHTFISAKKQRKKNLRKCATLFVFYIINLFVFYIINLAVNDMINMKNHRKYCINAARYSHSILGLAFY